MLKSGIQTINLSAMSLVDVDEKTNTGIPITSMTGVINLSENTFATSESVQNPELYSRYYEEAEEDYAQFRKYVKERQEKITAILKEGE